jgi:uncharacterized protein YbjT (DUF2867 family)
MSQSKVIAIMGATGAQGGGLVRAIQADREGPFVARAITRKLDSEWLARTDRPSRRKGSAPRNPSY